MTFTADFCLGKKVEREVCTLLKNTYPTAYLADEELVEEGFEDKGYDIVVPEKPATVEVKCDLLGWKYGNYFIETASGGKPSGLSTTQSNLWIEVDDVHILWIATESLKYLIRELGLSERTFRNVVPIKCGYLVPKAKLIRSPYAHWEERKICQTIQF